MCCLRKAAWETLLEGLAMASIDKKHACGKPTIPSQTRNHWPPSMNPSVAQAERNQASLLISTSRQIHKREQDTLGNGHQLAESLPPTDHVSIHSSSQSFSLIFSGCYSPYSILIFLDCSLG